MPAGKEKEPSPKDSIAIQYTHSSVALEELSKDLNKPKTDLYTTFLRLGLVIKAVKERGDQLVRRETETEEETALFDLLAAKIKELPQDTSIDTGIPRKLFGVIPMGTYRMQQSATVGNVDQQIKKDIDELAKMNNTTFAKVNSAIIDLGVELVKEEKRGVSEIIFREKDKPTTRIPLV